MLIVLQKDSQHNTNPCGILDDSFEAAFVSLYSNLNHHKRERNLARSRKLQMNLSALRPYGVVIFQLRRMAKLRSYEMSLNCSWQFFLRLCPLVFTTSLKGHFAHFLQSIVSSAYVEKV